MMKNFAERGIRHLGVEPSSNVADVARQKGVNTISEFFGVELAARIEREYGKADAILSANVMCHIPDLNGVAAGISKLLKPDGVLMFEDPYLGAMIEKTSYDQLYDEHVYMFSGLNVGTAFGRHGLELVDVMPQITHGGSMRYVLAPKGSRQRSEAVKSLLAKETAQGLDKAQTYEAFRKNCETSRAQLLELLQKLKREGKRVVGYGATSKSTTVTNYCGITPDLVEFISDTTPIKQGKLSPGKHIPVKPYEDFKKSYPDYALLFAWNHMTEIQAKESDFLAKGGRWIVFVPQVGVLP